MKMDAHEIVDGGHRAIKYTRLNGVRPTIYPEGTHLLVCRLTWDKSLLTGSDAVARTTGHLRCPGQAAQYRLADRHEGSADGMSNWRAAVSAADLSR